MKEKRYGIRFVIFMAAFVDGYRVVKEMADDFNRNGLFEKTRGTIFRFHLQMRYNKGID